MNDQQPTTTTADKPLLLTGKQAALALGLKIHTFNNLVRKKLIKPVEGFKSRRRYSEREILRYAYNTTFGSYEECIAKQKAAAKQEGK
jgi:hypothetical protein